MSFVDTTRDDASRVGKAGDIVTEIGIDQRHQARLRPASPEMWWCPVGQQHLAGGVLRDISRGGLAFVLSADVASPEVGDQIAVRFKTPSTRPLVYSVVRQYNLGGSVLLGCSRQLRPGVVILPIRRPKNLVAVRKMRRQNVRPSNETDRTSDLQRAA